jgi:hypothetical protein
MRYAELPSRVTFCNSFMNIWALTIRVFWEDALFILVNIFSMFPFILVHVNLLVTRCIKFNIQQLYVLPTLFLCVV